MVTAEDDWDRSGTDDVPHRVLDRTVGRLGVRGRDRCVAVIDHPQRCESVNPSLEVRPGRNARRPNRTWPEARARPV